MVIELVPILSFVNITLFQGDPGVVICTDDSKHGFSDGAKVTFSVVQGMEELNSISPVEIKVRGECQTFFVSLRLSAYRLKK